MHLNTEPGGRDWTVSAILIRVRADGDPMVLLHRHRRLQRMLPPGGHVERDEAPVTALVRELREETGYGLDQLTLLQPPARLSTIQSNAVQPMPFSLAEHRVGTDDHFHLDLTYALLADGDAAYPVDPSESQEIVWVPLGDVAGLADLDVVQLAQHACDVCLATWDRVALDAFGGTR
ncbi:NUDIX domain-containing protein [Leifsonia sp. 71-9]|uniref:NUDIX domain-containing protein n=1 Tax=Leifsonia sp. 71-9 TaxID=1895934 RepID=UPI00092A83AB|nr:NUDIX domain-containing protein [Leifsonia sp. 71-9]OJX81682.1 MAG: hypothetical protein BGO91_05015 [Leifsonia sp. 71-9]